VISRHCERGEAIQEIGAENWIASSPSAFRNDDRDKFSTSCYFRNSFIASSANTPPVI
jgi:hypothetical protein